MPFDSTPITSLVIDRLRRGRAAISIGGHTKAVSRDGSRYCATGAIAHTGDCDDAQVAALSYLCLAGRFSGRRALEDWNDRPERTQADVLALYDRAIELAVAEDAING